MKVTGRTEARERCTEAGWLAYDYLLDEETDRKFILSLRAFGGSFVFLEMLKKPFFKIESEHYMIKGLLKEPFFRMAVHGDYLSELQRLERFLEELKNENF